MDVDAARRLLAEDTDSEEPVFLPSSVLSKLSIDDLPYNTFIEIGVLKDGIMHVPEGTSRVLGQGGSSVKGPSNKA